MVTPVLNEGAMSVSGYFPASHWYDYYTGELIVKTWDNGKTITLESPIDHIPLHIRGGYILPTQMAALNTVASRRNPFGLIVAPDGYGHAKGDLFYDDGETDVSLGRFYHATFSLSENVLKMYVEKNDYSDMENKVLTTIRILGVSRPSSKLTFVLNKNEYLFEDKVKYMDNEIVLSDLNLSMTSNFQIEWTNEIYFTENSFGPIVDCALDNHDITQADCIAKGCMYYSAIESVPKCFVPQNIGLIWEFFFSCFCW